MKISLKKFGTMLISRPAGKDASAAYAPLLKDVSPDEPIEVDFEGVITMSPSWCDEFLQPLYKEFDGRVILQNTENPSVQATLKILEEIRGKQS